MKQRKWFPPLDSNQVRTSPKQDVASSSHCCPALFYHLNCCSMWSVTIIDWLEETHEVVKSSFVEATELDKTFILSSFVHFPKN